MTADVRLVDGPTDDEIDRMAGDGHVRAIVLGLLLTASRVPKKCLANTVTVLRRHHEWCDVLGYDQFSESVTKRKAPPVRAQDGASTIGEWTDADTTRTVAWIASTIGFEPSCQMVDAAVAVAAEANPIHPVREYLSDRAWDEIPRIPTMLATYFGSPDDEYTRTVGQAWMVSAVARVMRPGCQADHMIVLEGKQGTKKSTGIEALTPRVEWYADTGLRIGDKDSYQLLRGKWIYEFGELDALRNREVTAIKNYISARSDNYRPSYARRTRDFPRQCVFAGTTNESEYLIDQTGNRRFWPVRCGRVDVDAIRRDRDQLWAEAVALFDAGTPWHIDSAALSDLVRAEQAEREVGDDWDTIVATWLGEPCRRTHEGISTAEVLKNALDMRPGEMTKSATTRAGGVLRRLGYSPRQVRNGAKRERLYFPDGGSDA